MNFTRIIARYQRIQWLQPSVIALVVANLSPLAAVFIFHWDVFSLLFLFWLENAIIGVLNVLKMAVAGTGAGDLPPGGAAVFWVLKLIMIPFFCVHYGMFTFIHGIFVIGFFDKGAHHRFGEFGFPLIFQIIRDHHLEWPFAGLVISHLVSFGYDYLWKGEFRRTNPADLMGQPYRRVVVMHLTILIGGFLMMALHSPETGLVFLVLLKSAIDLWGHQNERDKMSDAKYSAFPFTKAPLSPALHSAMQARLQAGTSQRPPAGMFAVIIIMVIFSLGFSCFVVFQFALPFFRQSRQSPPPAAIASGPPVWKPRLIGIPIPETPASGKFRGADFSVTHAVYADQKLSLVDGHGRDSRSLVIALNLTPNRLPGVSLDLWTGGPTGLYEITMNWREDVPDTAASQTFAGGYAIKLSFGRRAKNKIPAKIYLCLPDAQKSFVAGAFTVNLKKEKSPPVSAQ